MQTIKKSAHLIGVLSLFLVATLAAAQDRAATTQAVRVEIDKGNAQYIKAFAQKDAAGVAKVYHPNGARLYPNGNILRGYEAIRADVQRFVDRVGQVVVTLETSVVWVMDNEAYEPGRWTYNYTPPSGEERTISGTYVNIWKRQADGAWKLFADLSLPRQAVSNE